MSYLIAFLSVIPLFVMGDSILSTLAPGRQRLLVERLALALGFGSGFIALVIFYASLLDARDGVLIAIAVSVFVIAMRLRGFRRWDKLPTCPTQRGILLSVVLGGLWLALLLAVAFSTHLGFDGVVIWGFKGKVAFIEGGWLPSFFTDAAWRVTHQDYPLLLPSLEAWVYTFLSQVDEQSVKVIFPLFYLGMLALFYSALRHAFSLLPSLFYTVLLGSVPYLASMAAVSGYADVPMMFFTLGAVIFLRRWMLEGACSDLAIGAILSAGAVWAKREGIVYWLVSCVAVVWHIAQQKNQDAIERTRLILHFTIPVALTIFPWFAFLIWYHIPNSDFASVSLGGFLTNLDRLPVIASRLLAQMLAVGEWGILWVIFLAVSVWRWRRWLEPATVYVGMSVFLPLLMLSLSFVFSIWKPYTAHLDLALDRLLLQPVPIAWYFIAIQSEGLDQWLGQMFAISRSDQ